MALLCYSVICLLVTWAVHLVIWRTRLPKNHTKALLVTFFCGYMIFSGLLVNGVIELGTPFDRFDDIIHFSLLYIPLSLTYTSFYSLIQYDSPSLTIVSIVSQAGGMGCKNTELLRLLEHKDMVQERIDAAVTSGFVTRVNDHYWLTNKGRILARMFDITANLLRLEKAG